MKHLLPTVDLKKKLRETCSTTKLESFFYVYIHYLCAETKGWEAQSGMHLQHSTINRERSKKDFSTVHGLWRAAFRKNEKCSSFKWCSVHHWILEQKVLKFRNICTSPRMLATIRTTLRGRCRWFGAATISSPLPFYPPPILLWQRKTDYGTSPLANATQDLPLSVRIAGECSEEPYPRDNGEKHLLQKRA